MTSIDGLVNELVTNIQGNKDIKFKSLFDYIPNGTGSTTYRNMGATIIDAVLQAGVKYESVVKPRITSFRQNQKCITTTSEFLKFINSGALPESINWKKEGKKIDRIINLTTFLVKKGIETEQDFAAWLNNDQNILELRSINGIGNKTVDYVKILCGIQDTVAIDVHLINFIKDNTSVKIDLPYETAKQILISVANIIKIEPAKLDHGIWRFMSQKTGAKPNCH